MHALDVAGGRERLKGGAVLHELGLGHELAEVHASTQRLRARPSGDVPFVLSRVPKVSFPPSLP